MVPPQSAILLALLTANICMALVESTLGLWMESPSLGFGTSTVGAVFACNTVATVLATPLCAYLGNLPWLRRWAVVMLGLLQLGVGLTCISFTHHIVELVLCMMLLGVGMAFVDACAPAMLADRMDEAAAAQEAKDELAGRPLRARSYGSVYALASMATSATPPPLPPLSPTPVAHSRQQPSLTARRPGRHAGTRAS